MILTVILGSYKDDFKAGMLFVVKWVFSICYKNRLEHKENTELDLFCGDE